MTLPVREAPAEAGRIHPISQVIDELTAIFADMGFAVAEGPDIETDDYNFTKLNFPEGHPAREMHDTFFFKPKPDGSRLLLRTHTSPVQIRTMLAQKPPIRVIIPGRTYRSDSDQTHTPMFHQVEGLVIDKTAHLGHLKWMLEEFCKAFFEVDQVKMRFRPSFFPFTEPSLEVDIQCKRDKGEVRFGEGEDWMEILGCGMVHPNVLRNCGLDPDEVQGFAWGMGIDRIAMLKYGMPDLRAVLRGRRALAVALRLPAARLPDAGGRVEPVTRHPAIATFGSAMPQARPIPSPACGGGLGRGLPHNESANANVAKQPTWRVRRQDTLTRPNAAGAIRRMRERIIWNAVRAHRMQGASFRRQTPIGPYVARFCLSRSEASHRDRWRTASLSLSK